MKKQVKSPPKNNVIDISNTNINVSTRSKKNKIKTSNLKAKNTNSPKYQPAAKKINKTINFNDKHKSPKKNTLKPKKMTTKTLKSNGKSEEITKNHIEICIKQSPIKKHKKIAKIAKNEEKKDKTNNINILSSGTKSTSISNPSAKKPKKHVLKHSMKSMEIKIKSTKLKKQNLKSTILPKKDSSLNKLKMKPKLIELEEINNKFLADYTNFDYLLSILEIVNNKEYYNIAYADKSKYFWQTVSTLKFCDKVFAGIKPETLRKYWRLLSKVENNEKLASVVNKLISHVELPQIKYNYH